jgi:hypothetical protein
MAILIVLVAGAWVAVRFLPPLASCSASTCSQGRRLVIP